MAQLASTTIYGDLNVKNNTKLDGSLDIQSLKVNNGLELYNDTKWLDIYCNANTQGSQGAIRFFGNGTTLQGVQMRFSDYDADIRAPFGLIIERTANNSQTTVLPYLQVQGEIYANSTNKVQHEASANLLINNKIALKGASDSWLRLNDDNAFSSGIYCGTSLVRTDGTLQVGASGATLSVNSTAITYKSNKIYHAGDKPTCADISALPLAGGTMTGVLSFSTAAVISSASAVTQLGYQALTSNGNLKLLSDTDNSSANTEYVQLAASEGIAPAATVGLVVMKDSIKWKNQDLATQAYVESKHKNTSVTFTKGVDTIKTYTHSLGNTNYRILCTSNSAERHVFWANKTATTVEIKLDSAPSAADIIVDVMLVTF